LENISDVVKSASNYFFEKIDIRDKEALETHVFKKHKPTDTINFSAESHVDNSIKNPRIFTETNIL
jgi:dTDP-glucose 4,6-dehydratase